LATSRRIYITGPMSGHPGFNYDAFDRAEEQLAESGQEPVSPADPTQLDQDDPDELAPGVSYEDCLAQAVEKLLSADAVALLPGWEDSHGARLEVALARRRGMEIRPLSSWLDRTSHAGAGFGLPPVIRTDPKGASATLRGTRPESIADGAEDGALDPLRVAEIEADAPTVMIDPTGTPAELRAGPDAAGRQAPRAELMSAVGFGGSLTSPETCRPLAGPRQAKQLRLPLQVLP